MEIYQGEPLICTLYNKKEDGTYASVQELESYKLEVLIKNQNGNIKKSWISPIGFTYRTDTTKGAGAGCATFKIKGNETKEFLPGTYTFEMAKIEDENDGDRAIGVLADVLVIKQASIKGGIINNK